MDYSNAYTRYREDPAFHTLVDVLLGELTKARFTPTEVREAAMVAQLIFEERYVRPVIARQVRDGL